MTTDDPTRSREVVSAAGEDTTAAQSDLLATAVPAWFDLDRDAHGHEYRCGNLRNDGTPCGARMRMAAYRQPGRAGVGAEYWELGPAPGETRWEEITWISPSWSTYDRPLLEKLRRESGQSPLPPGPVTNFDIPGYAGLHACGWYQTTRSHRFTCPDPSAPVLHAAAPPECCDLPMRLAPRGWACREDKAHVHPFVEG